LLSVPLARSAKLLGYSDLLVLLTLPVREDSRPVGLIDNMAFRIALGLLEEWADLASSQSSLFRFNLRQSLYPGKLRETEFT
jgi:hypothetical protein